MLTSKASLWLAKSRNVGWKFRKNFTTQYWMKLLREMRNTRTTLKLEYPGVI